MIPKVVVDFDSDDFPNIPQKLELKIQPKSENVTTPKNVFDFDTSDEDIKITKVEKQETKSEQKASTNDPKNDFLSKFSRFSEKDSDEDDITFTDQTPKKN